MVSSTRRGESTAPVRRLAMPDVPAMPFAAPMEAAVSITTDQIATAARALLAE